MKHQEVDIAIIGAGTAGLSAFEEIPAGTQRIAIIDRGPLGGTCSRVGCMPSKAFIRIADDYRIHKRLMREEHWHGSGSLDIRRAMQTVRALRDHFVHHTVQSIEEASRCFIQGSARFIGPDCLRVDDRLEIKAKRVIIATGSSPFVPKEWEHLRPHLVTTDEFFELEDLPLKWGVLGLGALGLELASALSHLDREVHAFDLSETIAGIRDPKVNQEAAAIFDRNFALTLNAERTPVLEKGHLVLKGGDQDLVVDKLLAALGRRPNLKGLDLENSGATLDKNGSPLFDKDTLAIEGTPHFIAGDVETNRNVLHEAADEGAITGINAQIEGPLRHFRRRVPLRITFSSPQIASIGQSFDELKNHAIGEASYARQGRATLQQDNEGLLRLYADKSSGVLLGAELIAPEAEHLAHILAFAIQREDTIQDMLKQPYYHPTLEEGLRTALRSAGRQCAKAPNKRWQELRDAEI